MTDFINTRDTLGDDATLRGIIDGSLEELNEDGITSLSSYGLSYSNLISVNMPNLKTIGNYGLAHNHLLENITMNKLEKINSGGCSDCSSLKNVNMPLLRTASQECFQKCTSLISINLPNVNNIGTNCFKDCSNLTSINLPKLGSLITGCFYENKNLKNISIPKVFNINYDQTFYHCYELHTIDLLNTESLIYIAMSALQYSGIKNIIIRSPRTDNSLTTTNIIYTYFKSSSGLGTIYVLDDLVDTYKTKWSSVANCIYPISSYPRTEFGTITDTWGEIFAAEEDGSYETKYNIGDTKAIEIDGDYIMMEIVAINTDVRDDESDIAKITWLSKEAIRVPSGLRPHNWNTSSLRSYLNNEFYNKINNTVKNKIIRVKKYFRNYAANSVVTNELSNDLIWIPSAYEISTDTAYENFGSTYPSLYNTNKRIKQVYNENTSWWLRSMNGINISMTVATSGYFNNSSSYDHPVVFGFCT